MRKLGKSTQNIRSGGCGGPMETAPGRGARPNRQTRNVKRKSKQGENRKICERYPDLKRHALSTTRNRLIRIGCWQGRQAGAALAACCSARRRASERSRAPSSASCPLSSQGMTNYGGSGSSGGHGGSAGAAVSMQGGATLSIDVAGVISGSYPA